MKKEDWDYISEHWGNPEESVLEKIASIKEEDSLTTSNYEAKIKEKDDEIAKLNQQNIDLNKTNMNLILRLTEPGANIGSNPEPERVAADINDLDAFIKEG